MNGLSSNDGYAERGILKRIFTCQVHVASVSYLNTFSSLGGLTMNASLFLTLFLVIAAPAPEFKLTEEEKAAIKVLEPFGFKFAKRGIEGFPYGTILQYNSYLSYDEKKGKVITAPMPAEKDLAPLAKLTRLRKIEFCALPFVSDTILDLLRDMSHLRHLDLRKTKISDEGLKKLARLRSLRCLVLDDTDIGDAGLQTLAEYPALVQLFLRRTRVTDRGLEALEKNDHLRSLYLGENEKITDGGIASLGKMPNLVTLWLNETGVTNDGLARMAKPGAFPKLSWIMLAHAVITGEGLKVLHDPKALPSLKRLTLAGTWVTTEDIKALKKARQGLEVVK